MRIGIDGRLYNQSGVGRYIRNLIYQLQKIDSENEYFIFLMKSNFNNLNFGKNFTKVETDFRWYGFSEQLKFPKLLNKHSLDLMHFPHFNVPIFYKGRFIVTIHDLIHGHHIMKRSTTLGPFTFKIKQVAYRKVFKTALTRSEKILVPSNAVKAQLKKEWAVGGDKITVTPEAVDDKMFAIANKMNQRKMDSVKKKLHIRSPYIFYVGNAHPHKNVEGLIKAYLILQEKNPSLLLVLSGNDHFFWQRLKKENRHPGILYTGFVTDEELVSLYKSATVFIMPSFEEGFGLPVLEAMASGVPVVSSGISVLKEVGGDAAVYFDPKNIAEMADKITDVLQSVRLKKQLIEKGKKRVKLFSWEKLAKQTLEAYHQCG